jgi:hypothetical protein
MDDAVSKAIIGLIVAAVGAVTFVAYRHPRAYPKLHAALSIILVSIVIGITIWNACVSHVGVTVAQSGLGAGNAVALGNVINRAAAPFVWTVGCIAALVYFGILSTLPKWLLEEEFPHQEDNKK